MNSQLTSPTGDITYARAYDPYGVVTATTGTAQTSYGYTGEFTSNEMVYLRARYYAPGMGRFLTRDTWGGDSQNPLSFNAWNYTHSNPINYSDPSGYCAGYKDSAAPINTILSFTAPYILDGEHWKATGEAWKHAWNTCVDNLQKAGTAISRGDYTRAYLYASGTVTSLRQAEERIAQINSEMDILWCKDASLGDKVVAGFDVGLWSLNIAGLVTPLWFTLKGALVNKYLGGLGPIGYYDDMLNPAMGIQDIMQIRLTLKVPIFTN